MCGLIKANWQPCLNRPWSSGLVSSPSTHIEPSAISVVTQGLFFLCRMSTACHVSRPALGLTQDSLLSNKALMSCAWSGLDLPLQQGWGPLHVLCAVVLSTPGPWHRKSLCLECSCSCLAHSCIHPTFPSANSHCALHGRSPAQGSRGPSSSG